MIVVESPGFFTSLQDQGRTAFRHLGVPVSGAMDQKAFAMANALLPNTKSKVVFECTYQGPRLRIEVELYFVVTGAPIAISLNGKRCQMHKVYLAKAGSILELGKVSKGVRSYLKFSAEILVPSPMGSQSYFYPITTQARLKKNDLIPLLKTDLSLKSQHAKLKIDTSYIDQTELDVVPGPDWLELPEGMRLKLFNESHKVSAQNRMGYRLSSEIRCQASRLLSQVVIPGMVQLTPGGQLLIATADCQVTGGYLQVVQLTTDALAALVQKPEGSVLTFRNRPH